MLNGVRESSRHRGDKSIIFSCTAKISKHRRWQKRVQPDHSTAMMTNPSMVSVIRWILMNIMSISHWTYDIPWDGRSSSESLMIRGITADDLYTPQATDPSAMSRQTRPWSCAVLPTRYPFSLNLSRNCNRIYLRTVFLMNRRYVANLVPTELNCVW